ncbi:transcriptional regulator, TetR family [Paenibacillus sophorae]|uniref:TetR family transcriptional regulator n=1 Tax=Paenibacillus sophorae TaxID=1333845 RepID=A0A1H8IS01_9BACL|nr:TetR family transcriptional regulator [Paenibacillus sophorae]QWU16033.1 TetR family transcriptional regulator [Paenibacillus sophorae]SEN70458.1 transcriptional regulator, TetR family [Paenibacillus sophorae]
MTNELPLTKEAILDAAEQVLRRYGPDKTSVIDIAKFLQVSHGTLYRHFASKAALREAVTERWLDKSIAEPLEGIADTAKGSAAEQLRLWLETLIKKKRMYAVDDAEMFVMYADVTLETGDMITMHINRLMKQIASIIERGMQAGEFKPDSADAISRAVFLATSSFHHPAHAHEWSSETIEEDFDTVWRLLLSGLK